MIRLALLLAALAAPAAAHSWYDPACCSGNDCAMVKPSAVEITPDGYRVTLEPGDHPIVAVRTIAIIPFGHKRERRSRDGDWHVCVAHSPAWEPGGEGQHVYCLYTPDMLG